MKFNKPNNKIIQTSNLEVNVRQTFDPKFYFEI